MDNSSLKISFLVAALYFGMDVSAQQVRSDSTSRERKIDEVVLIGYGSRKKSDLTSSVASVKSDEIAKTKVLNANQAIQGKIAGVNVVADDNPGSKPTVIIRGVSTVLGGRSPLYVVDGVQIDGDSNANYINSINPNDIESYDVLKDAVALSIYGNRAANGVIIITTKQGRGKTTVSYDTFLGVRSMLKTVKMAGSNLYAAYNNNALGTIRFSQDQAINTDWMGAITRQGLYTQNTIGISGSADKISFNVSAGYYDEQTILKGMDYKRFNLHMNNEYRISPKIKINQTLNFSNTISYPKPLGAFTEAYKQSPLIPVQWGNGIYAMPFVSSSGLADPAGSQVNNVGNPVATIMLNNERQKTFDISGNINAEYKITDWLKFNSQFGGEYNNYKDWVFTNSSATWYMQNPLATQAMYDDHFSQVDAKTGKLMNYKNLLTLSGSDFFNWNWANYLTFNKKFGAHDLEIVGGMEASSIGNVFNWKNQTGNLLYPYSNYYQPNLATTKDFNTYDTFNADGTIANGTTTERRLESFFGRLQYTLMGKYLLSASVRRDGTSIFNSGYRWGTFPSFGLGWIVTKEDFLSGNSVLNYLKLRGGWGETGNQNVPINTPVFYSDNTGYGFGGAINIGNIMRQLYNVAMTWETTKEISGGVDFAFLNNKLKGSFDIYDKDTPKVIMPFTPISTSGYSDTSYDYGAHITNKGVEASLRWEDHAGENFKYWIGGTFAHNKNNVESVVNNTFLGLTGGSLSNGQITKALAVGQPIGSFWLWEYAGTDANGGMLYYNAAGQKVASSALVAADRKYFGTVIAPSNYGVNIGFTYKNIDFSVDGYGQFGGKVYNAKKAQRFTNENIEYGIATNYWAQTNTSSPNPAPINTVPPASTYYLESSDFFRINNITLGYTLPKFTNEISSLRIYATAMNPFIWQKYTGYSPEINGDGNPLYSMGLESSVYPKLRSFVFGMNIKF